MNNIHVYAPTVLPHHYRHTTTPKKTEPAGFNVSPQNISPTCIWFTGLSGSGKSTIAHAVNKRLFNAGYKSMVLDGDHLRSGLCRDLGFSQDDRCENIRRAAETAKLFVDTGHIVLAAFITPDPYIQEQVITILNEDCHMTYVSTSLQICEERDTKGLYKKAREGKILDLTGVSPAATYHPPRLPKLCINTEGRSVDDCASDVITHLVRSSEVL